VYRKFGTIQFLIFIFLWTTIVYDPIARWSWSPQGWSNHLYSSLDFAGGTVVHISSGAAATAIGTYWGFKVLRWKKSPRFTTPEEYDEARLARVETTKPQNIIYIGLGTMLLWMGWFGFNGGSELSANARAASACISTQTAACFGGLSSLIIHWIAGAIKEKKNLKSESNETTQVFCDGVVVALVAITPAAGYVSARMMYILGSLLILTHRFQ
jgi:Amt family ammonium transporter